MHFRWGVTLVGKLSTGTTTKINVYDASFNVAFKTMSSLNYVLMFNDIEFNIILCNFYIAMTLIKNFIIGNVFFHQSCHF